MIEKFLSLFERFVVAVEAIASKAGPLVVSPGEQATPAAEGPKPTRSRAAKEKEDKAPTQPAADTSFDFLGGSAKKYERGDVKAALEKLVAKVGQPAAFNLFKEVGGVQALNDLPEDKFAAVVEAAEKELAKK